MKGLGTLGEVPGFNQANGINNAGRGVGFTRDSDGLRHAFLWTAAGKQAAKNRLNAFINAVNTQGGKLTPTQAQKLVDVAKRIQVVL